MTFEDEKMFGDRRSVDKRRVKKFDQQPTEPSGASQQPKDIPEHTTFMDMKKEIFDKLEPEQMEEVKDFILSLIKKNLERETVYMKKNKKGELDIETRPLPDRSEDIVRLMTELTPDQRLKVFQFAVRMSL